MAFNSDPANKAKLIRRSSAVAVHAAASPWQWGLAPQRSSSPPATDAGSPPNTPHLSAHRLWCHQQRFVVGRVINPHHIQAEVGTGLIVQQMPTPQSDESRLARDVPLHVGRHLRESAPRMQHRAVHRATPGFAVGGGGAQRSLAFMRKRPSRASCAVAAANCSCVAMPASTTSSRLLWTGGKSANTRATASSQLAPKRVRRTNPTRTP